jgi:hypothetical protein
MALKRSDNVFLLTLVDFLIQIIFFGLLVFVYFAETEQRNRADYSPKQVKTAIDAAGVSNIVELNDELSKLAPVRLKGLNERLGTTRQDADLANAAQAIAKLGGIAKLPDALARLAKLEQGSDKPPCLYELSGTKKQAKTLASAIGGASTITFQSETPELARLLQSRGLDYAQVRSLTLPQFRRLFSRVITAEPSCRYTLEFRETTRLVDARDTAGQIFYLKVRR